MPSFSPSFCTDTETASPLYSFSPCYLHTIRCMRISNTEKRRVAGINELKKARRATVQQPYRCDAPFSIYTYTYTTTTTTASWPNRRHRYPCFSHLLPLLPRKVTPLNANCYIIRLESNYLSLIPKPREVAARQNATLNKFTLRCPKVYNANRGVARWDRWKEEGWIF